MTKLMNRFRRIAGKDSLVRDDRGLSTVEYVIILVLIAAACVGTWQKLGGIVKGRLVDSTNQVGKISVENQSDGS